MYSPRVVLCKGHTRYTPALPPRFCATKWWCSSDSWRMRGQFFWTWTADRAGKNELN